MSFCLSMHHYKEKFSKLIWWEYIFLLYRLNDFELMVDFLNLSVVHDGFQCGGLWEQLTNCASHFLVQKTAFGVGIGFCTSVSPLNVNNLISSGTHWPYLETKPSSLKWYCILSSLGPSTITSVPCLKRLIPVWTFE